MARYRGPSAAGLPAIRDQRVIVRHALQPLALARGQPPDRQGPAEREQRSAIASASAAGLRLERRHKFGRTAPPVSRHTALETHRYLATGVGMAPVVRHRAERWCEWASVGSMILCREGSRNERTAAAGPILAGIEAIAPQSVGHERFALAIQSPAAALGVEAHGHERSGTVKVVAPATLASAAAKRSGNFFPRFAARRSIPAQAFALKKYRRGTAPVSKMSDNEDATASLGHSEELSVQHSPGATIPELRQRPDDGAKIPPAV